MAFGITGTPGGGSTASPAAFNVAYTVVSGTNKLFVGITHGGNSAAAASAVITWNTTESLTLVTSSGVDAGFSSVAWFSLDNPTAASANVTTTITNGEQTGVHIISFGEVDSVGTPSTNTGTGTNPSVTVVDSASDNIVISALCTDNENQTTTEANTLIFEVENLSNDTDHNSQYKTATGASTVMSWTNASTQGTDWAASGLAVKGAAGAAAALSIAPIIQNYRNMGLMN